MCLEGIPRGPGAGPRWPRVGHVSISEPITTVRSLWGSEWPLAGSGRRFSGPGSQPGIADDPSNACLGITPQTRGGASASPILTPGRVLWPKLSTPPRPGAVAARGLARAGTPPASCVLRRAAVSAPPRPVSPRLRLPARPQPREGLLGGAPAPDPHPLPLLVSSCLSGALPLWPRGGARPG